MHMPVGDLFLGCGAHVGNGARENQRDTGQGMVAIDHHLVVGNVGDGEQPVFAFAILGAAFELHADLDVFGKKLARFDGDQFRVVFAEGVFRLPADLKRIPDRLALQLFFDPIENSAVTAMQIDQRIATLVDASPSLSRTLYLRVTTVFLAMSMMISLAVEAFDELINLGGMSLGIHIVEGVTDDSVLVDHEGRPYDK
jgi:hypothetical protein